MQPALFDDAGKIFSVSALNSYIRLCLEGDPVLQSLWVEGEISNLSAAASGHVYFSLKDAQASLRCVIWRSSLYQLKYRPQKNGDKVLVHGYISVYETAGHYQLYVDQMEPRGIGALFLEFERLKQKLAEEGLFDEERKKPLPAFPRRIAVVTSPSGAAVRDIINILRRRYPLAQVYLSPTMVQGDEAPAQIMAALHRAQAIQPDVIILGRGGGSYEDLWAFNDETLARQIAASPVPVITGIGHEVDFTIADFVADRRAPTPSAAAELAVPDQGELRQHLAGLKADLIATLAVEIQAKRSELRQNSLTLSRYSPRGIIDGFRQRVDEWQAGARMSVRHTLNLQREHLKGLQARLAALDPQATVRRGYAIVKHKDGRLVQRVADAAAGDHLDIQVSDGEFGAVVS